METLPKIKAGATDQEWLEVVLAWVQKHLGPCFKQLEQSGACFCIVATLQNGNTGTPGAHEPLAGGIVGISDGKLYECAGQIAKHPAPDYIRQRFVRDGMCGTLSDILGPLFDSPGGHGELLNEYGIDDVLCLFVGEPNGISFVLAIPIKRGTKLARPLKIRLEQLGATLAEALRLRQGVENVQQHTLGPLCWRDFDSGRWSLSYRDDPGPLLCWDDLSSGRWSFSYCDDIKGHRVLRARKNLKEKAQLLQLSAREEEVVRCSWQGATDSKIASKISLDLQGSTIFTHRKNALKKLGIQDKVELIKVLATLKASTLAEEPALVLQSQWGNHEYVSISFRLPELLLPSLAKLVASLTPAEWEVACQLSQGKSIVEIAKTRERSENTVKNQYKAAFEKLEVGDAKELVEKYGCFFPFKADAEETHPDTNEVRRLNDRSSAREQELLQQRAESYSS